MSCSVNSQCSSILNIIAYIVDLRHLRHLHVAVVTEFVAQKQSVDRDGSVRWKRLAVMIVKSSINQRAKRYDLEVTLSVVSSSVLCFRYFRSFPRLW